MTPQYPSQDYANHCGTPARQPAASPLQNTLHCAKYWKCLIQTGHMLQFHSHEQIQLLEIPVSVVANPKAPVTACRS